jgi:TP901 family phage tail tape measure protein
MDTSTKYTIELLAQVMGVKDATAQLAQLNQMVTLANGTKMKIVGLENVTAQFDKTKKEATGAYTAIAKLVDATGKLSGTSKITFNPIAELVQQPERRITAKELRASGFARQGRGPWTDTTGQSREVPVKVIESIPIVNKYSAEMKNLAVSTNDADKASHDFLGTQTKLAVRAMAVIPIWMAFRAIWSTIIGLVTNSISEWFKLDEQLHRIIVTTNTFIDRSADLGSTMERIETAILNYGGASSKSFSEIATSMYALGSAGLTVNEQMAGFTHVMDLSIGTMGNVEQTAKLVAGVYNVFGHNIKGAYTEGAKFKKIADILAYTYTKQQVELDEIATGLSYVASVGNLVNVGFEDLVTTIGVLNTGMLKGSKAGVALMNAFIEIAQKSDKLAELGVVFDPNKPLNYRDVVEQLTKIYGENALSLNNLKEIIEVFGQRGGRAVAQLITDFDRWKKSIDDADAHFEDFAKRTAEEMEKSLPAAMAKLNNAIKRNIIDAIKDKGILEDITKVGAILEKAGRGGATLNIIGDENLPVFLRMMVETSKLLGEMSPILGYATKTYTANVVADTLREGEEDVLLVAKKILDTRKQIIQEEKKEIGFEDFLEKLAKDKIENGKTELVLRKEITDWLIKGEMSSLMLNQMNTEEQKEFIKTLLDRLNIQIQITEEEKASKQRLPKELATKLYENRLDILKEQGATESDILKQKEYYIKQLGTELGLKTETVDKLMRQLDIEKALTKEKRLQGRLGSDTLKLYDIAIKEGPQVAKNIGDLLAKKIGFDDFMRRFKGTKTLQIAEEQFPDLIKQQQAEQYLKGERVSGRPELKPGYGTRIPILEEFIRKKPKQYDAELALQEMKLKARLPSTTTRPVLTEEEKRKIDEANIIDRAIRRGLAVGTKEIEIPGMPRKDTALLKASDEIYNIKNLIETEMKRGIEIGKGAIQFSQQNSQIFNFYISALSSMTGIDSKKLMNDIANNIKTADSPIQKALLFIMGGADAQKL